MDLPQRKNIRLKDYDYRSPGYYYVTFCTQDRACLFGDVVEAQMLLFPLGQIVLDVWNFLPQHFLNVSLDHMQIMPNHVHAIIMIEDHFDNESSDPAPFSGSATLGQIIGYWKYQTAKRITELQGVRSETWQRNMFEHIIRNERELLEIRIYIDNNPAAWFDDIENPINLKLLQEAEAKRRLQDAFLPSTIIL